MESALPLLFANLPKPLVLTLSMELSLIPATLASFLDDNCTENNEYTPENLPIDDYSVFLSKKEGGARGPERAGMARGSLEESFRTKYGTTAKNTPQIDV